MQIRLSHYTQGERHVIRTEQCLLLRVSFFSAKEKRHLCRDSKRTRWYTKQGEFKCTILGNEDRKKRIPPLSPPLSAAPSIASGHRPKILALSQRTGNRHKQNEKGDEIVSWKTVFLSQFVGTVSNLVLSYRWNAQTMYLMIGLFYWWPVFVPR